MITLKRKENIAIFQVELALKQKVKQSPFISILILTQELEVVSSEILQEKLLKVLPLKACQNILSRLEHQGYLQKGSGSRSDSYVLTDLGQQSAVDRSFWIGEKGIYNVYISNSNLINQRIIKTEKVARPEDDRNSKVLSTPNIIRQCQQDVLLINQSEVIIEDVEENCFSLEPIECSLEIIAEESESVLKISHQDQLLFQTDLEIAEVILQEEILSNCSEYEYDINKKAILKEFNKNNLSFNRKVIISTPLFKGIEFNQLEFDNIPHIPSSDKDAVQWFKELLYKYLNFYFLDENSFEEYSRELAAPIQLHFNLKSPTRVELLKILAERDDAFYQMAKIETINYLNY